MAKRHMYRREMITMLYSTVSAKMRSFPGDSPFFGYRTRREGRVTVDTGPVDPQGWGWGGHGPLGVQFFRTSHTRSKMVGIVVGCRGLSCL